MKDTFDDLMRIILFIICFILAIYLLPLIINIGFYVLIGYVIYKIIWHFTDN